MKLDRTYLRLFIMMLGILFFINTYAQTSLQQIVLLDTIQLKLHRELYQNQTGKLNQEIINYLKSADELLPIKPFSVTDKNMIPPSGSKNDYMTMGPYWWPDSSKPDGLPYIRKDGMINPEYYQITDRQYLDKMISAVEQLAIAFYITNENKYAEKASELLYVWFIDESTKMNPNMKHAQFIPGINTGRGIGLIETRNICRIPDAVNILRLSSVWSKENDNKLVGWFEEFLNWITTHQYGIDEANEFNNHGTWYDVQLSAIAIFLNKIDYAAEVLENVKVKRINTQIDAEGKQPHELARTRSWVYSVMNLSGFIHLALMAEYCGVDLWGYEADNGGSIKKAINFLTTSLDNIENWKYTQLDKIDITSILPFLILAEEKYGKEPYSHYINKYFNNNIKLNEKIRIKL